MFKLREQPHSVDGDTTTWTTPDVAVSNGFVEGRHGDIPIRTYSPRRPARQALVWLHGGGFEGGDLDMPEAHRVSAELAARTDTTVVSVDYRRVDSRVHFPIPADDVHDVWLWMLTTQNIPMALGGAGTGATIALSVALRLRDRPAPGPSALLIAYPFAHFPVPPLDEDTARRVAALPTASRFTQEATAIMVRKYVGPGREIPKEAIPGACELDRLPPTHIVLSELDDLRPSGEILVQQLCRHGVDVRSHFAIGMHHGHLNRERSDEQFDKSLAFLSEGLLAIRSTDMRHPAARR